MCLRSLHRVRTCEWRPPESSGAVPSPRRGDPHLYLDRPPPLGPAFF